MLNAAQALFPPDFKGRGPSATHIGAKGVFVVKVLKTFHHNSPVNLPQTRIPHDAGLQGSELLGFKPERMLGEV